jgi:hypothetical protein
MLRPLRLSIALGALALCSMPALAAGSASAAGPTAVAAAACVTTPASLDGGYIIAGKDKGVSCATTKKLESGFQACRLKHGQTGRCTSKIVGYTCKEGHRSVAPDTFFAKVTCTKGRDSYAWTYEQNTLS